MKYDPNFVKESLRFDEFYAKAQVLLEMPYHRGGDYKEGETELSIGSRLSNTQLNHNRYIYLGTLTNDGIDVKLYTDSYGYSMSITGYTPVDEKYNDRIFGISLRKTAIPKYGEIWTVTNVQTYKNFRMGGLARTIYAFIAQNMGTIISDSYQYDGAVNLWKSLAKHSTDFGLKVILINTETKEEKEYDGTNIPDDVIWGQDEKNHPNMRLILMKK